jgi:hypothetical protein
MTGKGMLPDDPATALAAGTVYGPRARGEEMGDEPEQTTQRGVEDRVDQLKV